MDLFKEPEDFKKWADIFRKTGVESIQIGEISIKFRESIPDSEYKKKQKEKELAPKVNPLVEQFIIDNWSSNLEVQA